MNIGLYSFERLEIKKLEGISNKIKTIYWGENVNIYIYSENTVKQRIKERQALYQMIEDYEKGKIEVIIFENNQAFGSDLYTRSEILKMLLKKNIKFEIIEDSIVSTSIVGKKMLNMSLYFADYAKKDNDERSIMGNIIKDRNRDIVYVRHKGDTIMAKDEDRLKSFIEKYINQGISTVPIKEKTNVINKGFKIYTTEMQGTLNILKEALKNIQVNKEKAIYTKVIETIEKDGIIQIPTFLEFNKKHEMTNIRNVLKYFNNKSVNIIITKDIELILKNIKKSSEYKEYLISKKISFIDISDIKNMKIYLPMNFTDKTVRYVDFFNRAENKNSVI